MSTTKESPAKAQKKSTANNVEKKQSSEVAKKLSTAKVEEILNPSASARIKKLENFQLLAKKHEFLIRKKDELDKFIISSDGTKEKIILKNAEGYEFEVTNSQVVEKVVDVMTAELQTFIQKSEGEVLNFNI